MLDCSFKAANLLNVKVWGMEEKINCGVCSISFEMPNRGMIAVYFVKSLAAFLRYVFDLKTGPDFHHTYLLRLPYSFS